MFFLICDGDYKNKSSQAVILKKVYCHNIFFEKVNSFS